MNPLECRRLLPENLEPVTDFQDYLRKGGIKGLERAKSMTPEAVIEEIKKANLRGRGGAGFPTAIKWGGVRTAPGDEKYLVCNCSEGEPGTYKDRYLLMKNPYPLIEGMMIAAHAIGVNGAYIGIKKKYTPQINRITQAVQEMEAAGHVPRGFLQLVLGPDDYLFGEEKAMLEVIEGRGAMPRHYPPYVVGLNVRPDSPNPANVNNVETYNHVTHIMAKGADWFKEVGSEDSPGTMIFTVSGDVKRPGMYEVPLGTTVNQLLNDVCGGPVGAHPFKAIFSGVANAPLLPDKFDTPMDFGSMRKAGAGLGSAGFIVYDDSTSMVEVVRMLSNFLAKSSCGQCIPCNRGTMLITEHLTALLNGSGSQNDIEAILDECGRVTNQTRCYLPVQESILVPNTIRAFRDEFDQCIRGDMPALRGLVLPKIHDFDEESRVFHYDDPSKFD